MRGPSGWFCPTSAAQQNTTPAALGGRQTRRPEGRGALTVEPAQCHTIELVFDGMSEDETTTDCPPRCLPESETMMLRGRALRFVLVDELMRRPEATVADLVAAVAAAGFDLRGRASKVISDALRWEVRRGRIERRGRGIYRYRSAPRSTARRIRVFGETCRLWLVALTRTRRPERTGDEGESRWPDELSVPYRRPAHRGRRPVHPSCWDEGPPWCDVGWLWSS